MRKIPFLLIAIIVMLACVPFACNTEEADPDNGGRISVAAMNGPTMMGLGKLYNDMKASTDSLYTITKEGTPDAVIAGLANKTYDAACIPCNNAAIIYNNGNIGIEVVAVNTLNVLYLVQRSGTPDIVSFADLKGKTVYLPGQGSTPEYVLRYLIKMNKIEDVNIEFESEGSLIAAGIKTAGSKYDYAVLPQPAATTAVSGAGAAREVLNLADEWRKINADADIVTGVLVVRKAFLKNNKETFQRFLADYLASASFMAATGNIDIAAQYVTDMQIIPPAALSVAVKALPKCGITYIDGQTMKRMVSGFLEILYNQNKNAIGGKLPGRGFYYGDAG